MVRDPGAAGEVIPLSDYLFRHDRGSFWMASYTMPSMVGRALGFLLPSHRMYKMANALPSVFKKSEILLQDFMIPFPNIAEFVYRLNNYLGVWPLWFCPLKVIIRSIREPCMNIQHANFTQPNSNFLATLVLSAQEFRSTRPYFRSSDKPRGLL